MKRFSITIVLSCFLSLAALSQTPPPQALSQVRQYLSLTDDQVAAILKSNSDYANFSLEQQRQIQQAQFQIAIETAKDPLDPITLGNLYAGIESACRDLRNKAAALQTQNVSVLTDAQKAKLNTLNEAIKLAPIISEAQSWNLLGSTTSPPFAFSSLLLGSAFGVIGYPSRVPGCASPFAGNIIPSFRLISSPTESRF